MACTISRPCTGVSDMRRERAFVRPGRRVLRCANVEVRLDAVDLVADLIANGVPRTATVVTATPGENPT